MYKYLLVDRQIEEMPERFVGLFSNSTRVAEAIELYFADAEFGQEWTLPVNVRRRIIDEFNPRADQQNIWVERWDLPLDLDHDALFTVYRLQVDLMP